MSQIERGVRLVVKGAGERVTITGWAGHRPTRTDGEVVHDAVSGVWSTVVLVPARGWTTVELTA